MKCSKIRCSTETLPRYTGNATFSFRTYRAFRKEICVKVANGEFPFAPYRRTVRPKNRSQMSSRALVRSTCDQIMDFPSEISSRKSASMTFPNVSSPVPGRFPLGAPLGFPLGPAWCARQAMPRYKAVRLHSYGEALLGAAGRAQSLQGSERVCGGPRGAGRAPLSSTRAAHAK